MDKIDQTVYMAQKFLCSSMPMEDQDQGGENDLPKLSLPFSTVVRKDLLYHASTVPTIPEGGQLN